MRITIEGNDEEKGTSQGDLGAPQGGGDTAASPPAGLVERAAASGALSAGPAPDEFGSTGAASFVPSGPGTPETAPAADSEVVGQPAGAAPTFAAGVTEEKVEEES
jgi:hypothetical protein